MSDGALATRCTHRPIGQFCAYQRMTPTHTSSRPDKADIAGRRCWGWSPRVTSDGRGGWVPHAPRRAGLAGSCRPAGDGAADAGAGVFLDEMDAGHGHLGLVRPGPAEVPDGAGQNAARLFRDVFEDRAVTARRALVPDATSSGLAAAGSGTAKPLSRAARAGMMAEWPMMAARTGLDTTHGQLAVSRGRCCWPRARSSGLARTAWRSTWAAARAPMRWSCWLAAGRSWRSTLSQPGSRCSGHASRPLLPDGSAFCARRSPRRTCRART